MQTKNLEEIISRLTMVSERLSTIYCCCDGGDWTDPVYIGNEIYDQKEELDNIISSIDRIKHEDSSEWIDCSEKKPRAGIWVVVKCSNGFETSAVRQKNSNIYWMATKKQVKHVVCWKEQHKPYTGVKEAKDMSVEELKEYLEL